MAFCRRARRAKSLSVVLQLISGTCPSRRSQNFCRKYYDKFFFPSLRDIRTLPYADERSIEVFRDRRFKGRVASLEDGFTRREFEAGAFQSGIFLAATSVSRQERSQHYSRNHNNKGSAPVATAADTNVVLTSKISQAKQRVIDALPVSSI